MRVFLTGATGLVGRHVAEQLLARGYEVTALVREEGAAAALRDRGVSLLRGDVREHERLARAVREHDATVHAAAVILDRSDWAAYHALNVAPTEAIARAAAAAGRRLVHISSVAVYGRRRTYDGGPASVTEEFGLEQPLFPGDHYARSKREAELALWRVVEETGLNAVALRPCVLYGEFDRTFSPRLARALRRRIAPLVGNGGNVLSVVYAGNVAAAVLAALERSEVTGAFNVANDGSLTARQFVERFASGLGIRPLLVPVPRQPARLAANALDLLLRAVRPGQPLTLLKNAVHFLGSDNPYVSRKAVVELGWRPLKEPAVAAEDTGRWFARAPGTEQFRAP
ncbi:MAG TPA: NAD-dependent epimerase/dehydratase family protein [Gemmatimonadales bacterium]|nr:NAD-dependent epimerase/dehydratase family protein [Gemmatimonadales bacterium]